MALTIFSGLCIMAAAGVFWKNNKDGASDMPLFGFGYLGAGLLVAGIVLFFMSW